jgi:hypothetical protein
MKRFPVFLLSAVTAFVLAGCEEPRFEFRGYSDRSNCRKVIDAELDSGSILSEIYDSPDPESTDVITELMAEIHDREVAIEVACRPQGQVSWVHYVALAQDPVVTGEIYARYAAELQTLLGTPTGQVTEDSRSLHYLCREDAPIVLEEYRLEPEVFADGSLGAERHEVYLAVIPAKAACLTESP